MSGVLELLWKLFWPLTPWESPKDFQGSSGHIVCNYFGRYTPKIKIIIFTCLEKTLQDFTSLYSSMLTSNQAAQTPYHIVSGLGPDPRACSACTVLHMAPWPHLPSNPHCLASSALQAVLIHSSKAQKGLCAHDYTLFIIFRYHLCFSCYGGWWLCSPTQSSLLSSPLEFVH